MNTVLIPVGDSPNSRYAAQRAVNEAINHPGLKVHLLNVQLPLPRHIARFLTAQNRADYHRDRAEEALKLPREIFDRHNVPYEVHRVLGPKAESIVAEAKRLECDHILMSTSRKNSLTRMLEDSTTNNVLELSEIPVELVPGDAISKLERYGVPAGIGGALALMIAAAVD